MNELLARLAERLGILLGYHEFSGHYRPLEEESARRLIEALGFPAGSDGEVSAALAELDAEDQARLAPVEWIGGEGHTTQVPLNGAGSVAWRLTALDGQLAVREGEAEGAVVLDGLRPGRYRLSLERRERRDGTLLLVRPARLPVDGWLERGRRFWGITGALYGLRSRRDLGVGDYADLAAAAAAGGRCGADFFGINPVHALPSGDPVAFSPYSPSHRAFFNTRYLALDRAPEFEISDEARRIRASLEPEIRALRDAGLIDYGRVAAVQRPVLQALFQAFGSLDPASPRRADFEAWRRRRGDALERFVTYQALTEIHGNRPAAWPGSLATWLAPGVEAFRAGHAHRTDFHAYAQYLAECQLQEATAAAKANGMALGLYLDLAVGTGRQSAEVWGDPGAYARGVSLGAPPDQFNPAGQGWDLAAFHPTALRQRAYQPLVDVLRSAMAHAGLVRVDHIIGFQQCFWMPDGGVPGGYVRYPREALLALLAIEAAASDTIVVGEDLGLVPPDLRGRLDEDRVVRSSVLVFERYGEGFRSPGDYPAVSFASFGTHDLPTVRGWWKALEVDALLATRQIGEDEAARMRGERDVARRGLWEMLQRHGLLPEGHTPEAPPAELDDACVLAVHRLLAGGRSLLVGIQLDDILGVAEQANLPGTVDGDGHPNWRRRMPVDVEDVEQHRGWLATCAALDRGP